MISFRPRKCGAAFNNAWTGPNLWFSTETTFTFFARLKRYGSNCIEVSARCSSRHIKRKSSSTSNFSTIHLIIGFPNTLIRGLMSLYPADTKREPVPDMGMTTSISETLCQAICIFHNFFDEWIGYERPACKSIDHTTVQRVHDLTSEPAVKFTIFKFR